MTDQLSEQEVIEKIAKVLAKVVIEAIKHSDINWVFEAPDYANQILAQTDAYYKEKYAGYVKLADDQPLEESKSLFPPF